MTKLSKLLRCASLFGGDCKFVHEAKTKDEIMHVFSGHLAKQHKEIIEKLGEDEIKRRIEKNIEGTS